jgi:predicted DNA repair protein MutK
VDLVAFERDKIRGAVRTDFILSAEIVVISLGTVADATFGTRVMVLAGIATLMTVGVYGLVAGIVKLDDAGLYLSRQASKAAQALGRGIVSFAPWLMKGLSVAGTAAMFLVGGGIILHGLPLGESLHAYTEGWWGMLSSAVAGIAVGAIAVGLFSLGKKILKK